MPAEGSGWTTRTASPLASTRLRLEHAWERGERLARALTEQIRPRVRLTAGSAFVLLTLYLPIAYEACGPNRKGYEVVLGKGIWPGLLTFVAPTAERAFYIATLALAALTILLVLASALGLGVLGKRTLLTFLLALTGTFSLFLIADVFWLYLGLLLGDWLKRLMGDWEIVETAAVGAALVILLLCLRSRFLRGQRWIFWLLAAACIGCLLVIADFFLRLFSPLRIIERACAEQIMLFLPALYWAVPVALWYRFGLWGNAARRSEWLGIRSRIAKMYAPVALADIFFLGLEARPIWGFSVFFVGLHLMTLGYMQLARKSCQQSAAEGLRPSPE